MTESKLVVAWGGVWRGEVGRSRREIIKTNKEAFGMRKNVHGLNSSDRFMVI